VRTPGPRQSPPAPPVEAAPLAGTGGPPVPELPPPPGAHWGTCFPTWLPSSSPILIAPRACPPPSRPPATPGADGDAPPAPGCGSPRSRTALATAQAARTVTGRAQRRLGGHQGACRVGAVTLPRRAGSLPAARAIRALYSTGSTPMSDSNAGVGLSIKFHPGLRPIASIRSSASAAAARASGPDASIRSCATPPSSGITADRSYGTVGARADLGKRRLFKVGWTVPVDDRLTEQVPRDADQLGSWLRTSDRRRHSQTDSRTRRHGHRRMAAAPAGGMPVPGSETTCLRFGAPSRDIAPADQKRIAHVQ